MLYGIYAAIVSQTNVGGRNPKQEQDIEELKSNFKNIFDNTVHYSKVSDDETDYSAIVINAYEFPNQESSGRYILDIRIPRINIENDNISTINSQIKDTYVPKLVDIVKNSTQNTIYNISYVAYINDNILSLAIKSTLKEGATNPQRIMLQTFNINLNTNELIEIEDLINRKNLDKRYMQSKINEEVEARARETKIIIESSGVNNLYQRNPQDSMYEIENAKNYFLGENGCLYIIYAYGNNNFTGDIDVIVF